MAERGGNPRTAAASGSLAAMEEAAASYSEGSTPVDMEKKLNSLSDELVKLELEYNVFLVNPAEAEEAERIRKETQRLQALLFEIEEVIEEPPQSLEQRQKLISKFDEWNLRAQSYIGDHVKPYFSASLFHCHKTLIHLHNFIDLNLHSRSQALSSKINVPLHERPHEEQFDDNEEKDDTATTIFKRTVEYAKGILSEIQQDIEQHQEVGPSSASASSSSSSSDSASASDSTKMTLDEYLEKTDEIDLPFEFTCFANIRLRAALAGIQLSKLLAQYVFYLSDRYDEVMMEKLVSKIKRLAGKVKKENCDNDVAEKFVIVMDSTIKQHQQQQQKKKKKQMMKSDEDSEMEKRVMKQIYSGISVLGFILCDEIVPKKNTFVNGARVTVEVILGLILFHMQGLRVSIGKNNHHDDHESWKKIKDLISFLWDMEQYKVPQVSF